LSNITTTVSGRISMSIHLSSYGREYIAFCCFAIGSTTEHIVYCRITYYYDNMPRHKYRYNSGENSYDLHSGGLLGIPTCRWGAFDIVFVETFTVSLLRPIIYLNVFIKQLLTAGVTGFCIVRSTNKWTTIVSHMYFIGWLVDAVGFLTMSSSVYLIIYY